MHARRPACGGFHERRGEGRGRRRAERAQGAAQERPRQREDQLSDPLAGPRLVAVAGEEGRPEELDRVEPDLAHRPLGLTLCPVVEDPRVRVGAEGAYQEHLAGAGGVRQLGGLERDLKVHAAERFL